jgi:uncharacterized protein (TIGR03435 family)
MNLAGMFPISRIAPIIAIGAIGILIAVKCDAQPAAPRPEFEVASIKTGPPGARGWAIVPFPGGRLQGKNVSLKRLIAMAYSVTDNQVFGDVNWLTSEGFDFEAKASGPATVPELRLMVQSLLDDRFKLKIHRETRELPIYSLVLARTGEKLGPGLVEAPNGDCGVSVTPQAPPPKGVVVPNTPCGGVGANPSGIHGQRARIAQLADRLSTMLGRPVLDETGLRGSYDIALTLTPDARPPEPPAGATAADPTGPSLFTAIQEQLGLKLQGGKGPVDVIVIDAVEKPSAN